MDVYPVFVTLHEFINLLRCYPLFFWFLVQEFFCLFDRREHVLRNAPHQPFAHLVMRSLKLWRPKPHQCDKLSEVGSLLQRQRLMAFQFFNQWLRKSFDLGVHNFESRVLLALFVFERIKVPLQASVDWSLIPKLAYLSVEQPKASIPTESFLVFLRQVMMPLRLVRVLLRRVHLP